MDLRCKNVNCNSRKKNGSSRKLGEAIAPSYVEIMCPVCKEINTFILTIKEENQTAKEQQSFIDHYEKTPANYRRSA